MTIPFLSRPAIAAALASIAILSGCGEAQAPASSDKAAIEKIVRDYLLAHPELLMEMSNRLEAKQAADQQTQRKEALAKVGIAALADPKVAFVTGPADAKVTVAEFFDYRCPHCKATLGAMKTLVEKRKDVRFAFIDYPILTADSLVAAKAAVAAKRQEGKYLPFHFALLSAAGELPKARVLSIAQSVGIDAARLEKDMEDPAVLEGLKAATALAEQLQFDGTPTFVVNDTIIVGEASAEELEAAIKAEQS